jgi:hypothetical protein
LYGGSSCCFGHETFNLTRINKFLYVVWMHRT